MAQAMRAILRKIWDDRGRPATGALGRIYLGRLEEVPRIGRRLVLFVDRSGAGEPEPDYLATAPVERVLGDPDRGLLFVDTGKSIYRVVLGAPHVAALGRLGRRPRDRRAFSRLPMQRAIRVHAAGGRRQLGVTENVSAGGVLFRSAGPLFAGETVELMLQLHDRSLGVQTHATGRVVRTAEADGEGWELPRLTAIAFDEPWTVG